MRRSSLAQRVSVPTIIAIDLRLRSRAESPKAPPRTVGAILATAKDRSWAEIRSIRSALSVLS